MHAVHGAIDGGYVEQIAYYHFRKSGRGDSVESAHSYVLPLQFRDDLEIARRQVDEPVVGLVGARPGVDAPPGQLAHLERGRLIQVGAGPGGRGHPRLGRRLRRGRRPRGRRHDPLRPDPLEDLAELVRRRGVVVNALAPLNDSRQGVLLIPLQPEADDLHPESLWKFRVRGFGPLLVAMDSHGGSLYEAVDRDSRARRDKTLARLGVKPPADAGR